jgi:cyclase
MKRKKSKGEPMKQIKEKVYVETGIFACNLGLVTTKEGNVLIDTPHLATDAARWRDEVMKKGDVRYLINTEEHPDHTETSHFFPGTLITHQKTRETLAAVGTEAVMKRMAHLNPEGMSLMEGFRLRLADITFTENLDIFLGDLTIRLFSLPGHSPGGIGVYIPEERVVFTTDIIFHRKKSWLHEADPEKWLESLKRIGELDVDVIVPGHGEPCDKNYLAEQAGIVQGWIDEVKSAIKRGLDKEQAFTGITIPDPHPKQPNTPFTAEELDKMIIERLYSIYSD